MSRTERGGYNSATEKYDGNARDWSCGNPHCCGGKAGRKARRSERAKLKAQLRRDPETTPTRPTTHWPY